MATTASIPAYLLPGVPVHQPPHLEGDASLATEILPGPPPIGSTHQTAPKRDGKKLTLNYSYLPTADPGSTYSGIMHGTLIGQDHEGPHSKRARIDKGTATGRAQRASARSQGNSTSILDPLLPTDPATTSTSQGASREPDLDAMLPEDLPVVEQGPLAPTSVEPGKDTGRPRRKDKGKGKEVITPPLRVKEEPKTLSLHTPEPSVGNLQGNEDHCSACRSFGSLVYCDGCPRAFHLWCLNPPLEGVDEGDARWFCPACVSRKHPPRKPPSSLLAPLIHHLQTSNPVEFQLPDDVKYFFKDVASGPKGTYVDSTAIKPPRLNRLGLQEDRDPHRLRDRNGDPVLCYGCGKSALPNSLTVAGPPSKRPRRSTSKATSPDVWKNIISCDYCTLHWHLDCLDPPLPTMPPFNKKWMCPNHVERVLPPKRRIPKHGVSPIEITKPKQFNSGNIDVIYNEPSTVPPNRWIPVDEVLINGRRYRVPERIIILDFWNKLNKEPAARSSDIDAASVLSSPLSSLSSLDESDEASVESIEPIDDLTAAQMLCGLSTRPCKNEPYRTSPNNGHRRLVDHAVQTDTVPPAPPVTRGKVGRPRKYPLPTHANGVSAPPKPSVTRPVSADARSWSAPRRRRPPQPLVTDVPARELRSRSRNTLDTPIASESSMGSTTLPQIDDRSSKEGSSMDHSTATSINSSSSDSKTDDIVVKLEDVESSAYIENHTPVSSSLPSKRVGRTVRQSRPKDPDAPRRGRKRKQRDEELPSLDNENGPVNEHPHAPDSATKKTKANGPPSMPSTPLTIRLPPSRFNNNSSTGAAKPGLESPSRR